MSKETSSSDIFSLKALLEEKDCELELLRQQLRHQALDFQSQIKELKDQLSAQNPKKTFSLHLIPTENQLLGSPFEGSARLRNDFPAFEAEKSQENELKTLENALRNSVLCLEKENFDLKYENSRLKGNFVGTSRKSLLEIQETETVETDAAQVFDHFLRLKSAFFKELERKTRELDDLQQENSSVKAAAIQNYIEKESIISEISSKLEKAEQKIAFFEETQHEIQREREQMQKKIVDLALTLDREAELNERRRKNLEEEVNERVEKRVDELSKRFVQEKTQILRTVHACDEKIRRHEEKELLLQRELKENAEKFQREVEIFQKTAETSPENAVFREEIAKIVGKYEKKIQEIAKDQLKEKQELKDEQEEIVKENREIKRKVEVLEAELKRTLEEKASYLKKIDEKTKLFEATEDKFFELKQEFKEKLLEMENTYSNEKKTLELRLKSLESVDDRLKLVKSSTGSCVYSPIGKEISSEFSKNFRLEPIEFALEHVETSPHRTNFLKALDEMKAVQAQLQTISHEKAKLEEHNEFLERELNKIKDESAKMSEAINTEIELLQKDAENCREINEFLGNENLVLKDELALLRAQLLEKDSVKQLNEEIIENNLFQKMQLETLREELAELTENVRSLSENAKKNKEIIDGLEHEREKLLEEFRMAEAEKQRISEEMRRVQRELEEIRQNSKENRKSRENLHENQEFSNENQEFSHENQDFKENQEFSHENQDFKENQEFSHEKINENPKEIDKNPQETPNKAEDFSISALKQQLEHEKLSSISLKSALEAQKLSNSELVSALASEKQRFSEETRRLTEKYEETLRLKEKLSLEIRSLQESSRGRNDDLLKEIQVIHKGNVNLMLIKGKYEQSQEKVQLLLEEISNNCHELSQLKALREHVKSLGIDSLEDLHAIFEEKAALFKENAALLKENAALLKEKSALCAENQALLMEKADFVQEKDDLLKENLNNKAKLLEMKEKLDFLESLRQEVKALGVTSVEDLQNLLKKAESPDETSLRRENLALRGSIEELNSDLQLLKDAFSQLKAQKSSVFHGASCSSPNSLLNIFSNCANNQEEIATTPVSSRESLFEVFGPKKESKFGLSPRFSSPKARVSSKFRPNLCEMPLNTDEVLGNEEDSKGSAENFELEVLKALEQQGNAGKFEDDAVFRGEITNFQGNSAEMQGKSKEMQGKSAEMQGKSAEMQGKSAEMQGNSKEMQGNSKEMQRNQANREEIKGFPEDDEENPRLAAKIAELEQELMEKSQEIFELREKIREKQEILVLHKRESLKEIDKMQEISAVFKANAQEIEELRGKVQALEAKDREIAEKAAKIEDLQGKLEVLEGELQGKVREIAGFQEELRQFQEKTEEMERLLGELALLRKEKSDFIGQMLEKSQEIEAFSQKIKDLEEEVAEKVAISKQLQEKVKEITTFQDELREKDEKLAEITAETRGKDEKIASLSEELAEKRMILKENTVETRHFQEKTEEIERLLGELALLRKEKSDFQAQILRKSQEIEAFSQKIKDLEVELAEKLAISKQLQEKVKEIASFQAELREKDEKLAEISTEMLEKAEETERLRQDLAFLRKEKSDFQSQILKKTHEIELSSQKLKEMEAKLCQIAEKDAKISSLQAELSEIQTFSHELSQQLQAKSKEIGHLRENLNETSQKLEEMQLLRNSLAEESKTREISLEKQLFQQKQQFYSLENSSKIEKNQLLLENQALAQEIDEKNARIQEICASLQSSEEKNREILKENELLQGKNELLQGKLRAHEDLLRLADESSRKYEEDVEELRVLKGKLKDFEATVANFNEKQRELLEKEAFFAEKARDFEEFAEKQREFLAKEALFEENRKEFAEKQRELLEKEAIFSEKVAKDGKTLAFYKEQASEAQVRALLLDKELEKARQPSHNTLYEKSLAKELERLKAEHAIFKQKAEDLTKTLGLLRVSQQKNAELLQRLNSSETRENLAQKEKARVLSEKAELLQHVEALKQRFAQEIHSLTAKTQECMRATLEFNPNTSNFHHGYQNSLDFLSNSIDDRFLKENLKENEDLRQENEKLIKRIMYTKLKVIEDRTNMLAELKKAEEEAMDYKVKYAQVALDKDYYVIKYQNLLKEIQRRNIVIN